MKFVFAVNTAQGFEPDWKFSRRLHVLIGNITCWTVGPTIYLGLFIQATLILGADAGEKTGNHLETALTELKALQEKGLITKEDYDRQKQKLLDSNLSVKQPDPPPPDKKRVIHACVFSGDENFNPEDWDTKQFSENADANVIVKELIDKVGAAPNFVVRAGNVPNAAAIIQGFDRYIVYSPSFLSQMKDGATSNWSVYSILAHEIGHHIDGHTLVPGGSRPDFELQADEFSGHVLARMGATLQQAQAAMKLFGSDQDGPTHPSKSKRLAAIQKGYNKGKSDKPTPPIVVNPGPDTPPVRQSRPCIHRVACSHLGPCLHQTGCIHTSPCTHQMPCGHTMSCGHRIACQHPYGFGRAHAFDILHPFDTVHPFDLTHPADRAHEYDWLHPNGDPLHDFDFLHPDGD